MEADSEVDFVGGGGTGVLAPPRQRAQRRRRTARREPPARPPNRGDDGQGRGGGGGWNPGGGDHGDGERDGTPRRAPAAPRGTADFALWLSMFGISTLFVVLLAIWLFLIRSEGGPAFNPPRGLWTSTLLLLASGIAVAIASHATRQPTRATPQLPRIQRWLCGAFLFGLGFLLQQGWLWWTLVGGGVVPSSGAHGAIFFMLTGLHALHAAAGLTYMALCAGRLTVASNEIVARVPEVSGEGGGIHESVRLCAVYWHFMGGLWLVLFAVLYFIR